MGACVCAPPQLCFSERRSSFGFTARRITALRRGHRALLTRGPSCSSMPEEERSRPRVFYLSMDFLLRTWPRSPERYLVDKPSLSSNEECLSLHVCILSELSEKGKETALPPADESCGYPRRNHHEVHAPVLRKRFSSTTLSTPYR